jgi:YggT family protein
VSAILTLAVTVITVVQLMLLARVISSWVLVLAGHAGRHPGLTRVDAALARMTEPILAPIRRVIPPLRLGSLALDLAVPVALIALSALALVLSAA